MATTILTDEKLASIPSLLQQGMKYNQIAALFGCTPQSLRVICSKKRVSLRPPHWKPATPKPLKLPNKLEIKLPIAAMEQFNARAKERGISCEAYANRLLEIIVQDNLYKAVLDD